MKSGKRNHGGLVVTALLALGAVVWGGCGGGGSSGGSYYCDNTGCYSCDGYSCAGVAPPSTTSCMGPNDCPTGSSCTTSGCEASCTHDSDCPQGDVCTGGYCVPPGTKPGTPIQCTTSANCLPGHTCGIEQRVRRERRRHDDRARQRRGRRRLRAAPRRLRADLRRDTRPLPLHGEHGVRQRVRRASRGRARPSSNACQFSSQCAPGDVCADGQMPPLVRDDHDHLPFELHVHQGGRCEPNGGGGGGDGGGDGGAGGACTTSAQCSSGAPVCAGGECATVACTTNAQCLDRRLLQPGRVYAEHRPHAGLQLDDQLKVHRRRAPELRRGVLRVLACTSEHAVRPDRRPHRRLHARRLLREPRRSQPAVHAAERLLLRTKTASGTSSPVREARERQNAASAKRHTNSRNCVLRDADGGTQRV